MKRWIAFIRVVRLCNLWMGAFIWVAGVACLEWRVALNGAFFIWIGLVMFPYLIRQLEDNP